MSKFLKTFFLSTATLLQVISTEANSIDFLKPGHRVWIAPEFYQLNRHREGGSKQSGPMYGGRIGYDYIKRSNIYLGAQGLIASGHIKGNSNGTNLKSKFTDKMVEGRIGYTFQSKNWCQPYITPFAGFGYFWESNHFEKPRDFRIHFDNQFSYVPVGFLSEIFPWDQFSIGLNFTARVLIHGRIKTSNDPQYQNSRLLYQHKLQYRVELPLSYYFCCMNNPWRITVEPFYEYRHYGSHINHPFDFMDTKFNIYGVNVQFYLNY